MSNPFISVRQLSKYYQNHTALNQVSFEIKKGSVVGLLGPNGAGKTSLLRIITGIIEADQGEVLWEGKPITSSIAQIGYLPEERGLYKKMSAKDYLLYLSKLRNIPLKKAIIDIDEWFEKLALLEWQNHEIMSLSKGMQQKIQFIAAVLHNPLFLILDEPFSGFDPINEKIIIDHILDLTKKGITILLSTHRMDSVEELCDEIIFLNRGEVIYNNSIEALQTASQTDYYLLKTRNRRIALDDYLKESHNTEWIYHIPLNYELSLGDDTISLMRNRKSMKEIFIMKTENEAS